MTARDPFRLRGAAAEPINSRYCGSPTLGPTPQPLIPKDATVSQGCSVRDMPQR